ncbi:MAG TPA: c-type cytochrome domain-containing protein [Stellaceae bacterium]|nr:c-type cytochrome domain-containing protein [Stellaceae bacterium]
MKRRTVLLAAASVVAVTAVIGGEIVMSSSQLCAAPAAPTVSFAEDILPLFKWRCGSCHQPGGIGTEKSGLDLTTYEGVMKGTKFGRMVIPGDPESSNLMLLLDWRVAPELRMPHGKKKLSTCDRDSIRAWIREGAKNN